MRIFPSLKKIPVNSSLRRTLCASLLVAGLSLTVYSPAGALPPDPVPAPNTPAANPEEAMRITRDQRIMLQEGAESAAQSVEDMRRHTMNDMKNRKGMGHDMVMGCMMKSKSASSMIADKDFSDRSYLSAMIAHHEAAVDMAQDALRDGKDPQVRKWAEEVVESQEPEIRQMTGWLESVGGMDKEASDMMKRSMSEMMEHPSGGDADYNFVSMMLGHHAGAVEMAVNAAMGSDNPNVIRLSRSIINAQLDEIAEYKAWLAKHPKP